MRNYTAAELQKMKGRGAVVFTKPEKKPVVVEKPVDKPVPEDRSQEVIEAARTVIAVAEQQMGADKILAEKIAAAINETKRPVSYRCIVKRGNDKLLKEIKIIPIV